MEILKTKYLSPTQSQQINHLWDNEYPAQLKERFNLLLRDVQNFNHYLIEKNNQVAAWAVEFEKDNETRFSIIVDNKFKRKGLGSFLLKRLQKDLNEFYGWVIDHNNDLKLNGEYYESPLDFYLKNGFEVLNEERIDNEILKAVKIKYSR